MSGAAGINTAVQRQLLAIILRNSARSTVLLMAAVAIITTLGFQSGQATAAWAVLVLGLVHGGGPGAPTGWRLR